MPKYKSVAIDGIEQWLYLIKRFGMTPKEALETMDEHGQDVASVLVYLEKILASFNLRLPSDILDGTLCRNGKSIDECDCC